MSNEQIIAKEKVLALIRKAAESRINISEAYLFGSYARNEQQEFSDIDIALVSDDFQGNSFLDSLLFDEMICELGSELEVHTYKPQDFHPHNLFVQEIINTGIRIL